MGMWALASPVFVASSKATLIPFACDPSTPFSVHCFVPITREIVSGGRDEYVAGTQSLAMCLLHRTYLVIDTLTCTVTAIFTIEAGAFLVPKHSRDLVVH